jgi:hypothetical protein
LLGRDTHALGLVRRFTTALWWVAWLLVLYGLLVFALALFQAFAPGILPTTMRVREPPLETVFTAVFVLLQFFTPLMLWAFFVVALAVHDVLVFDEDSAEDGEGVDGKGEDEDGESEAVTEGPHGA